MVLTQGQRVRSHTLLGRIGDANMGQVWVAGASANISAGKDDMIRRFWRECTFQQDGDLFQVMHNIRGGSLEETLSISAEVFHALDYAFLIQFLVMVPLETK